MCLLLVAWLLTGCDYKPERQAPHQNIDVEKIEQVAFDFHFGFYDKDLNLIELSEEEVAYFFELKSRRPFTVNGKDLEYAEDHPKYNSYHKPKPPGEEITTGGPPPEPPPYEKTCAAAGVPIPPAFSTPTWKEIGSLKKDQIFSDPKFNPLYIWRYQATTAPLGLCAATVRYKVGATQNPKDKGANVQVVGVICQGTQTGNACFWASEKDPFGKMINAFELNGNTIPTYKTFTGDDGTKGTAPLKCTFCHLGANAFIVHPGTVLDGIRDKNLAKRYTPVSNRFNGNSNDGDFWGNPIGGNLDDGNEPNDCRSCHNFAKVNKVWCKDVLQKTLGKTMPPPQDGMTSAARLPEFRDSLMVLKRQCAAVKYDLKF